MLILGQGGTGKTTLIGAITETFRHYNKLHLLAKCATTGIAASDIGAYTLHSWAGLGHNLPKDDNWLERSTAISEQKRNRNIQGKEFLIVDEISMEDKTTACCLSEIIAKSRALEGKGRLHALWNPWPVASTSHPGQNSFFPVILGVDKEKPFRPFFPVAYPGIFLPGCREYSTSTTNP